MIRYQPEDMLVFAKVAELRSISGAARVLALSKASVSRAIARLEDALQARLLERSSRHLTVTEAGRTFFFHCQRVREEIEAAEAAVGELQGGVRGQLRVAVPLVFGRAVLAQALPGFMHAHPDLQLEVRLTNRLVDPIEEAFDVVVRIGPQSDSALLVRELGRAEYAVYASPAFVHASAPLTHPQELAAHRVLDLFDGQDRLAWVFRRGGERASVEVRPRLDLNDAVIRRDAAIAGLGPAMLPSWLCAQAEVRGQLVRLLPQWRCERVNIVSALWPSRRNNLPRLRVFLDFLAHAMQDQGLHGLQRDTKDR